jgi:hypothetical protein
VEDGVGPMGRAGLGVCGLDTVEEYCVWKLLHERTPDFHRERGQVYVDFWDAGAVEEVVWVCVPRFPRRDLVFCELEMIHKCQLEPQAAVISMEIRWKTGTT